MLDPVVTVIGNLTADPVLRVTATGQNVVALRVASTPRVLDRDSGEWRDGVTVFLSVTAWRSLAANAAASLHKGDRVIVTGRLRQRDFEKDGVSRSAYEVEADGIGPDLARATVTVQRIRREPGRPVGEPAADAATVVPPEEEDAAAA